MRQTFEDLKKQLSYQLESLQSRINESNLFNLLRERYESLSIFQQKIIKHGAVALLFLLLIMVPLSYFFSSMSYWKEFQEKRSASLAMLQARSKPRAFLSPPAESDLKLRISNIVRKYREEGGIIKNKPSKRLNDKKTRQIDFEVEVNLLNVREAIQLGTDLHDLPQSRLASLIMRENPEHPKRYDVSFALSFFLSKTKRREALGSRSSRQKTKKRKKGLPPPAPRGERETIRIRR